MYKDFVFMFCEGWAAPLTVFTLLTLILDWLRSLLFQPLK